MSETIYNQDGSVYMTFAPAKPSTGDLEGWVVRHVTSGTHKINCCHPGARGTWSVTSVDVESFNGLLKIIADISEVYGHRPFSSKIVGRTFRWTWERDYGDGHTGSDMIIASKIDD